MEVNLKHVEGGEDPGCGNAYMGRDGAKLRKQVQQDKKDAEEKVIKMAERYFGEKGTLRKFQIGADNWATLFERKDEEGEERDERRVGKWVRAKRRGDDEEEDEE